MTAFLFDTVQNSTAQNLENLDNCEISGTRREARTPAEYSEVGYSRGVLSSAEEESRLKICLNALYLQVVIMVIMTTTGGAYRTRYSPPKKRHSDEFYNTDPRRARTLEKKD